MTHNPRPGTRHYFEQTGDDRPWREGHIPECPLDHEGGCHDAMVYEGLIEGMVKVDTSWVPEHTETEADEPANDAWFRAVFADLNADEPAKVVPSPLAVAARRQARLEQEYLTPKYTTSTKVAK